MRLCYGILAPWAAKPRSVCGASMCRARLGSQRRSMTRNISRKIRSTFCAAILFSGLDECMAGTTTTAIRARTIRVTSVLIRFPICGHAKGPDLIRPGPRGVCHRPVGTRIPTMKFLVLHAGQKATRTSALRSVAISVPSVIAGLRVTDVVADRPGMCSPPAVAAGPRPDRARLHPVYLS